MKTIPVLMMILAGAPTTTIPLRAADEGHEMKCACMKEHEDKMKAAEKKMGAEASELQKLVDEMNASTGEKKLAAMAAVINKMAQSQKASAEKVATKPADGNNEASPKEEAEKPADPHAEHHH